MNFTNNFNIAVVVFVYNLQDPVFFTVLRDSTRSWGVLPLARAEASVAAGASVTLIHPTDGAWFVGVKKDTFFGRIDPFIAPLTAQIYDSRSKVELTAAGALILHNAPAVSVPTPRATERELNRPLPAVRGHVVGVGRANITDMAVRDPASALPMQGWASPSQVSKKLEIDSLGEPDLPLLARAFIVADPESKTRAVFVVADIWSCSIAIKQEVVRRLSFGSIENPYQDGNITIAGTHTHSGPAGYLHHFLYNATAMGFDPHVFESVVSGIIFAIEEADRALAPGRVTVSRGQLSGITRNRSLAAFAQNPAAMTSRFPNAVDDDMTQLVFEHETKAGSGKYTAIGLLNWFAIHPTNMGKQSSVISGDNKGWAAHVLERDFGNGFVAGFANGCAGDVSGNFDSSKPGFESVEGNNFADQRQRMILVGEAQADFAKGLLKRSGAVLAGPIAAKEIRINLAARTGAPAALGLSMAAGSVEDGGQGLVDEGITLKDIADPTSTSHGSSLGAALLAGITLPLNNMLSSVSALFSGSALSNMQTNLAFNPVTDAAMVAAHFPKPILLSPGLMHPDPWTPEIVPLQLVQIGQFAMFGIPAEVTTVAGLHLRQAVAKELGPNGIEMIAVSTYTNGYAQYVTTAEEYDLQHYEGASTLFGRSTLQTIENATTELAKALIAGRSPRHDGSLVDLRNRVLTKRRMTFRNDSRSAMRFRLYLTFDTDYWLPLWPDADFIVSGKTERAIVLPFPHSLFLETIQVVWGQGSISKRKPPRQRLFALTSDLILARSATDVVNAAYFPPLRKI